ncbi:MAG TPA: hypothetical protein VFW00_02775, partial [Rhodocyclaceae bacterium]|nr:hypothetical protein [Rhodocyclaceae bacterium]
MRDIISAIERFTRRISKYAFSIYSSEEGSARWLTGAMRASIIVPVLLLAIVAVRTYLEVAKDVAQRLERTARIVDEHALKVLETAATVSGRIADEVDRQPAISFRENEFQLHEKLIDIADGMSQIQSVWLWDSDGAAIASNLFYPVSADNNIANREYFIALKRGSSGPILSGALHGRLSGDNFFSMTRRWETEDASFNGVIGVSLSQNYFTDFYRSISGTDNDLAVMLVREDGEVLLSFPNTSAPNAKLSPLNPIMRTIQSADFPGITVQAGVDGASRMVKVQKVGGYPLYLAVGILQSTVMSQWRDRMAMLTIFIFPASAALMLLCWTALKKVRREHAVVAQWRE